MNASGENFSEKNRAIMLLFKHKNYSKHKMAVNKATPQ
jgi:hypothetical protein